MRLYLDVKTEGRGDTLRAHVRKMERRKRQAGSVEIGFFPVTLTVGKWH